MAKRTNTTTPDDVSALPRTRRERALAASFAAILEPARACTRCSHRKDHPIHQPGPAAFGHHSFQGAK